MGVGDQVPAALEQIGARVEMITPEVLASGDLSRYTVIVTGVRAYERRADLRANNNRLLDYVEQGGTVLVQYNKFEFNEAQYGPYPAKSAPTASPTRTRRWRSSNRRIESSPSRTGSVLMPGRAGCRSAGCTSSATGIRATSISSGCPIRSSTIGARKPEHWSRRLRKGPLDLHRARPLAAASRRDRRSLSAHGKSDQPPLIPRLSRYRDEVRTRVRRVRSQRELRGRQGAVSAPLMAIQYAHLVMLAEQGILPRDEARRIRDALDAIRPR